jgi:L-fuconolactonase
MTKAGRNQSAAGLHFSPNPEWLAQRTEEPIEPDLPIVDAHHHLWDQPGRRYLFEDLAGDVRCGHNIRATVFAQCHAMYRCDGPEAMKPVGETEFVNGAAAQSASGAYGPARLCAGIVGSVDLLLGSDVAPVLEAHIRAGNGRFRGIRARTAWHKSDAVRTADIPPDMLTNPVVRRAIRCIQDADLIYDIWAYHSQLDQVLDLCRAFPDLTIVLDHIGGPILIGPYAGKYDQVFSDWRENIKQLSRLPNVFMKVGGMGMRFGGNDFNTRPLPPTSGDLAKAWGPFVETCIEAFGANRCMFESNFPVDKAMCSYGILWNGFKRMARGCSPSEKNALFSATAASVYRIEI